MSREETTVIIFRDAAGAYYLVPLTVVEAGRVPAAAVPQLEAAMGGGIGAHNFHPLSLPAGTDNRLSRYRRWR